MAEYKYIVTVEDSDALVLANTERILRALDRGLYEMGLSGSINVRSVTSLSGREKAEFEHD